MHRAASNAATHHGEERCELLEKEAGEKRPRCFGLNLPLKRCVSAAISKNGRVMAEAHICKNSSHVTLGNGGVGY